MSKETKSDTTAGSTGSPAKGTPLTEIQARVAQEQEQGFRGTEVDPTPNEHYTVAGVTAGKPTPETDAKAAKDVRHATGVGLSAIEAADREKDLRGEK